MPGYSFNENITVLVILRFKSLRKKSQKCTHGLVLKTIKMTCPYSSSPALCILLHCLSYFIFVNSLMP